MKTFLALLFLSALSPLLSAQKPNILVFYLDDMAWAQPGAYGGKLVETPNMDSIASSGVRFTNGYSSGCVCSPGRVGLMTGRYQARTGHDANPTREGRELLLSEKTIAQHLKPAGYTTGLVGKWHLGDTSAEFLPQARGFDFSMGTVGNLGEGKGPSFYRGSELLKELEGEPITSPIYAREACGFIESNKDKPFFLALSFNAVHTPHVASPKWLEKFKHLEKRTGEYAAIIGEADEAIGTVMTKLRDLKLEENTLIFCISDNGGASPISEQMGLRGHKWFVWEGGVRVTWMAQWKGHVPAGRVVNDPVIQLDVLPTALAAAGAEPLKVDLDGVNLLPLLEGKQDKLAPRELYFRFGVQHAVRQGDWKLVKASKDMDPMLVNLATDPGEQKDLSTENPTKKAELQTLWEKWDASMQPPRWEDRRWNGEEQRKPNKKGNKKTKQKEE
ncbi:sulfatase-like hydrolase/transferase [Brevifollis gellanilyticus]|uniref:N-acetylgalactosamine-6-sulfatase n=1 Tax=Brevifollis gellanilyticus TaxID=748831 RepID=A0A512MA77_9BACT|nr:sulfatase-like hydrolase/transferase [Brevifollis gellanilyticus]GEP43640.1 N-acetylgalactosamine-6-sulfatase [Brevifollis gellanilyticus]